MEETLKEVFIKKGKRIRVEKGHALMCPYKKEDKEKIYYLEKGVIALLSYSKDGTEFSYQYFMDGRLVGYMPALFQELEGFQKYKRTIEKDQFLVAKTESTLYYIDRDTFNSLLNESVKFNHLVMQSLAINYMDLLNHTQHLKKDSAGLRLCQFIVDGCEIFETNTFPEGLTFIEIGKYLGIHAVSVSRLIATLKREGCIAKEKGGVVVTDLQKLKSIVEEENDRIFK